MTDQPITPAELAEWQTVCEAEEWRPVTGFEGRYEVSDQGRVRSLPRPRSRGGLLNAWVNNHYLRVCLGRRGMSVHRLVAGAFLPPAGTGQDQVRHLNGDPMDNRATNLAWGTASENASDKIVHGTNPQLRRTHCPQGHPYDAANTYMFRGARQCKACKAEFDRRPTVCLTCGTPMRQDCLARHVKRRHRIREALRGEVYG